MHPWLKVFLTYIKNQLPSENFTLQHALLLSQRFAETRNYKEIKQACEFLSTFNFITIKELHSMEHSFVNSLTTKTNDDIKKNILVCYITWDAFSQTGMYSLKDNTGEIECICSKLDEIVDQNVVLLTSWSYITNCNGKSMFNSNKVVRKDFLKYMEINEFVLFTPVQRNSLLFDVAFISIFRYFKEYQVYGPRDLINLEGQVILKSPVHRLRGCNPFFFVRLRCLIKPQSTLVVVVQGRKYMNWHCYVQVFDTVKITNIKLNVLNKKTDEERKILCGTKSSKILKNSTKTAVDDTNEFHLGTVHYTGIITSTCDAEFGLYCLDEEIRLLLSHQPCLTLGKGLRKGARVKLYNVHRLQTEDGIVLCCCTLSTVQIVKFSEEITAYDPFIPQLHPIASQCQDLPACQYLWLIDSLKKICSTQNGEVKEKKFDIHLKDIQKILFSLIAKENKTRSIFSEFIDLPHSCIFTRKSKHLKFSLVLIKQLLLICKELISSKSDWLEGSLDWLNGREFDQYQKNVLDDIWKYTIIDSTSFKKELTTCGLITCTDGNIKIWNGEDWMFMVGSKRPGELDGKFIFVKKFQLVLELFVYQELSKSTGEIIKKSLYKTYMVVDDPDNITVIQEINENHAAKKQKIDTAELVRREECFQGLVLAREFKRSNHLCYDVEYHYDNQIYIPSIGKIQPATIIQSNQSLYPLTTSVLILRVLEHKTKQKISVYFDSNKLLYPMALLPGASIRMTNLHKYSSKKGSVYYKMDIDSTVEIQNYPAASFESLKQLIDQSKEEVDAMLKRVMVITCYQNTNSVPCHQRTNVFLVTGRITLVHSVCGKWKCFECNKDVWGSVCTPGCRGRRRFTLEMRCVLDDGSAECYLHVDDVNTSKLLDLSKDDIDLLKSTTNQVGSVTYQRTNIEAIELLEKLSKKRKCEVLLQKKVACSNVYRCRHFRCKQFNRKELTTDYQNSVLVSGGTEYHTLSQSKVLLQCITFKSIDYKLEMRKHTS